MRRKRHDVKKNNNKGYTFIPFVDSKGNRLESEEEIVFTNEDLLTGQENVANWGLGFAQNTNYLYANEGNNTSRSVEGNKFPVIVRHGNHVANIKMNKQTKRILPCHAGTEPVKRVIFIGPTSSGKTVLFNQMVAQDYLNMIAADIKGLSFSDDMPMEAEERKSYEEKYRLFKTQHKTPEPTRVGEDPTHYYFYTKYKNKAAVLEFVDIEGEACENIPHNSKIFYSDYYVVLISAEEMVDATRGNDERFLQVIDHFLSNLQEIRGKDNYQVLVVITKADLLFNYDIAELSPVFQENTIVKVQTPLMSRFEKTVYKKSFKEKVFYERSAHIEEFLMKYYPNMYNQFISKVSSNYLKFSMIASIGSPAPNNEFKEYKPFAIDEPFICILASLGLYPVEKLPDRRKNQRNLSFRNGENKGIFFRWRQKMKDTTTRFFDETTIRLAEYDTVEEDK